MLKWVKIFNIVLIEQVEVTFDDGFNVITGETGSGKSAMIAALKFLMGGKADPTLLRHHSEKAFVEAAFDIEHDSIVIERLRACGIHHEPTEEFLLRRELFGSGKSRCQINHEIVHLNLVKKISESLIEIVGQHHNRKLLDEEEQRNILDLFAKIISLKRDFQERLQEESRLKRQLGEVLADEASRLREMELLQKELDELEEAALHTAEEDERLFQEYTRWIRSQELRDHTHAIVESLQDHHHAIIPALHQLHSHWKKLCDYDATLQPTFESFRSISLELEEVAHSLRCYQVKLDCNPQLLEEINGRLTLLNRIKKRFGPTLHDAILHRDRNRKRLYELSEGGVEEEALQQKIMMSEEETNRLAERLTKERTLAARSLEKEVEKQLASLNMAKAKFFISLTKRARSSEGDERVEFHFTPNVGEKQVAIQEAASGGELARLMLAFKAILADRHRIPTIIFDEIDANIGGRTARGVGEKLAELAKSHQLLLITHFPQVAKWAHHHLQIAKVEQDGRTYTKVTTLDEDSRGEELARMAGEGGE